MSEKILPTRDKLTRLSIYLGEALAPNVGNLVFYLYQGKAFGTNTKGDVFEASDFGDYEIIKGTIEYSINFY